MPLTFTSTSFIPLAASVTLIFNVWFKPNSKGSVSCIAKALGAMLSTVTLATFSNRLFPAGSVMFVYILYNPSPTKPSLASVPFHNLA